MGLKKRISAAMKAFSDPSRLVNSRSLSSLVDDRITQAVQAGQSGKGPFSADGSATLKLRQFEADGNAWKLGTPRWDRVRDMTRDALTRGKVNDGLMLEIGGRHNPRNAEFKEFRYQALDLKGAPGADIEVAVGDITNCPHIADNSYDFIFSFDVFEHINKPWLAASEIQRILKPGGVTVHSTLFAWRYHPCPIDYWRYTAEGLKSLFEGLECLTSEFDYTERRRDVRGQGRNAVKPDAFGGWRENVRVNYAGRKPI